MPVLIHVQFILCKNKKAATHATAFKLFMSILVSFYVGSM